LLNRNATIFEDTLVSIDVGNPRCVADCLHVSRVVETQRFSLRVDELSDVFGLNKVAIFALLDGDGNSLASTVVVEFECVSGSPFDFLCDEDGLDVLEALHDRIWFR
jgi:hypothetical protein